MQEEVVLGASPNKRLYFERLERADVLVLET